MVQRMKTENLTSQNSLRYIASRYNVRTYDDQENLLLYNSFTGEFVTILKDDCEFIINILMKGTDKCTDFRVQELIQRGFLVDEKTDQIQIANFQQKQALVNNRVLNLILMPNEDCNFRCIYCYESFAKNKMEESVQEGVIEYVKREIRKFELLHISWFGGEPTTALEIVEKLSVQMIKICKENGKAYTSNMTTNGYNLNLDVFKRLLRLGVRSYQITFDGTIDEHDQHRVLIDGGPTFERIYSNLMDIKNSDLKGFKIIIRTNVDEQNKSNMNQYIRLMSESFGGDPRFTNHFVPVQKLGGTNDSNLHLCDTKELLPFIDQALDAGLDFSLYRQLFKPHGSVCYAAKPNSFVIGSDGMVYKCTVAFDDERNHVGQLNKDGKMELYHNRLALWVANGAAEDVTCQSCYFRPSCQGEACPLERIENGKTPCPPTKKNLKGYLRVLAKEKNHVVFSHGDDIS
ncbi:radical SAM protein [Brevibacillus sp. NRS-1366]|uniref:radical SAM protein n=1 Tax=Brevibacillus sp. NRS-1366 TaxID=3233899 RepID=UPI003D192222